ncbi:shikimate kinase [soil metagenome]
MVILLMGILGSGKTSIATLLSKGLNYKCIELDDYVLAKTQYKSVGEAYEDKKSLWKEKELESTKELSIKDNMVIVCGGAMVENNLNILYFQENCQDLAIIYLQTRPKTLTQRLTKLYDEFRKSSPNTVLKRMEKYYDRRNILYHQYADFIVNTEESTPEEATQEIMKKLKK